MITILLVIAVLLFRVCIATALSVSLARQDGNRVDLRRRKAQEPARRTGVDRQVMTLDVPAQDCLTKDNTSVRVEAVVCFRVLDAGTAPDTPEAYRSVVSRMAQTSLRSVIGSAELENLVWSHEKHRATTEHAPTGPQDAPLPGPRDAAGRPQDAADGPPASAHVVMTVQQVEEAAGPVELLGLASTLALARTRGATRAFRELAGRRDTTVETTILEPLPRPTGGPAYLGGRDDAAYLRGWDDAVDWTRQGNEAQAPTWGSAAYMTGWNDAVRAIARAPRG